MRLEHVDDMETQAVVKAMVEAEGLVSSDLDEDDVELMVLRDGISVVACGGLEIMGPDVLLRSLVVRDGWRGRGIGVMLLAAMEAAAKQRGVATAWLLTTGPVDYFRRRGYEVVDRQNVVATIAGSRQFKSLCPASAFCMRKALTETTNKE